MNDVNKSKRDAADLFGYWADTDKGQSWARKSEDEIMDDLGIDRDDPRNEKRFEAAAAKIDEMARREGWTDHNGREYLQSVVDRHVDYCQKNDIKIDQKAEVSAYLDRAENRRAAEAAESNAKLEKLEAARAAERSQKNAQTPRMSM
jgi:hypothetical protein